MDSRIGFIGASALALALLSGCSKFKDGVNAYYAMEYEKSLGLLEPYARKAVMQTPVFKLRLDAKTSLEQAAPHVTADYFAGWQAYAGSKIGLNRESEGCDAIKTAMRPITFDLGKKKTQVLDPWEGDFWQLEVYTIRAWYYTLPCPGASPEPSILD